MPRTRIERLVREETAVTPDTALRLARYFGTTPEFWLGIQIASMSKQRARCSTTTSLRSSHARPRDPSSLPCPLSSRSPTTGKSKNAAPEKICQLACKPGSVWRFPSATAIHLGRGLLRASSNQPGRRRGSRWHRVAPRRAAPIRSCSRWGLPCRLRCRTRGALLPHLFTLAFAGRPAPAVCFLWHFPWGRPRRPLAATVDPWSPDFPPPGACGRKARSPGSDRPASWQAE